MTEEVCECLLESGASSLKRNKQHLLPSDLAPDLSLCQLILKAATEEDKMVTLMTRVSPINVIVMLLEALNMVIN